TAVESLNRQITKSSSHEITKSDIAPLVSPFGLAGGAVALLVAAGDDFALEAGGSAEEQFGVSLVMSRVANDASSGRVRRSAAEGDVRELFVFVAEFGLLQPAMRGGALQARGEVAPVTGRFHGTTAAMRAGSNHGGAGGKQCLASSDDVGESWRRARFDDDEQLSRRGPGAGDQGGLLTRRQLVERIRDDDEIGARERFGESEVARNPVRVAQGCKRRVSGEAFSGGDELGVAFDQCCEPDAGEGVGRGPERGAGAGAEVEQRADVCSRSARVNFIEHAAH